MVERELDLAGYFCIITSEKMSAKEAIELYKSHDTSEKLFRGDKSYLGNKSIRVYSEESARAKIFVEVVAMILRCKMYIKLKEEMKKLEKKPNYMTVPAALKELEKIEMVRQLDNVYRLDHAVTCLLYTSREKTERGISDCQSLKISEICVSFRTGNTVFKDFRMQY